MRNIFLETSYTKCGGEAIPRSFSKQSKLSIQFVFSICQVKDYRNILKLSCRPLAFASYEVLFLN